MTEKATLAVILVNWRNAPDTIECLETLLRSSISLNVIVCDNASGDGSVEKIIAWASGKTLDTLRNPALDRLLAPDLPKPIDFRHLKPGDSPAEGAVHALTIFETGGNLGYSGGNNAGLRLALKNPAITHFWLLNNDTVVERETAASILRCFSARPDVGMVGTDLCLYDEPSRLQMQAALRFDKWTGRAFGIGAGRTMADRLAPAEVERAMDFICGASMTVSRAFLEKVGLLEERYFLYYEEIDWALRGKNHFALAYCPDTIVYHKEGASAGSSSTTDARSPLSEYHHTRSRLIFSRLHFPLLMPLYFGYGIALAAKRFGKGQRAKAAAIMRASFGLSFVRR